MRKKSHISLARYLVHNVKDENLQKHKWSFYLGSILPDIKPSFIYKRHEITATYPKLRKEIEKLSEGKKHHGKKGRAYFLDLGQVTHYLADYFTYPHNKTFHGGFREHCSYEERLKRDLRAYLKKGGGKHEKVEFHSPEALCSFIQKTHDDYNKKKHDVEGDIRHIVEVNQKAVEGMIALLSKKKEEHFLKHS